MASADADASNAAAAAAGAAAPAPLLLDQLRANIEQEVEEVAAAAADTQEGRIAGVPPASAAAAAAAAQPAGAQDGNIPGSEAAPPRADAVPADADDNAVRSAAYAAAAAEDASLLPHTPRQSKQRAEQHPQQQEHEQQGQRKLQKGAASDAAAATPAAGAEWPVHGFPRLAADAERQAAVRDAFLHSWVPYREHAWGQDTLKPLSRRGDNGFLGMGISITDSLSTLAIMGLDSELAEVRGRWACGGSVWEWGCVWVRVWEGVLAGLLRWVVIVPRLLFCCCLIVIVAAALIR
jgi:hypothetical protein